MKLRHPLLLRVVGQLAALVIHGWMSTIRTKTDFRASGRRHPVNTRSQRYIYAFWHESILFPLKSRGKLAMLISQHADGELVAQICRHYRVKTIRGSKTRGGDSALLELIKVARDSNIGITPDGPRGPRRKVQPGVISLASLTGLPILSFGVGFVDAWRAKSWDRFAIPKLYSTMTAVSATTPVCATQSRQIGYRTLSPSPRIANADCHRSGRKMGGRHTAGNLAVCRRHRSGRLVAGRTIRECTDPHSTMCRGQGSGLGYC